MLKYNGYNDEELTPYKKKKVKSGKPRSNHKHLYEECLVRSDVSLHKGKYCTVCGKTQITDFFLTVPSENSSFRRLVLNKDEIVGMFPNLPIKDEK